MLGLYMPYILWLWQQKIHWESPIFLDQHFFSGFMWHAETIQSKVIRKSTHVPAFNRIWKNYTKKSINQLLCVCTYLTVSCYYKFKRNWSGLLCHCDPLWKWPMWSLPTMPFHSYSVTPMWETTKQRRSVCILHHIHAYISLWIGID